MFGLRLKKDEENLLELSQTAQDLILDLQGREPDNETFEQEGIIDGLAIIKNFVKENEIGIAIEHLLYMVHESDISYPSESLENLHKLVAKYKTNNYYR